MQTLSLYVHWPFCKAKCPYCDFNSHVREGVDQAAWQQALVQELAHYAAMMPERRLESIFFGGGTPSLMPPETVAAVIDAAVAHWPADAVEITLEANPTSVEAAKLAGFKQAGVNRVSMGVQALRQEDLSFLGREHSVTEALKAWDVVQGLFARHSFDLIYARPHQTVAMWEAELEEALRYAGEHLSLYQLTIEPATPFYYRHQKGQIALPEEEIAAQLYELTQQVMDAAGLPAYEVSNHARPGQECRHNLTYWRAGDWVGIGPGAHGRYTHKGSRVATVALRSPEKWLRQVQEKGQGCESVTAETSEATQEEILLMGLRLSEGVEKARLYGALDEAQLAHCIEQGMMREENGRLFATTQGRLLLNHLIERLLTGH